MSSLLAILLSIPVAVFRGLVLVQYWHWFVMPTFHGAPDLRIPVALGIASLLQYATVMPTVKQDDDKGPWYTLILSVLTALFVLALGWLFHLFV